MRTRCGLLLCVVALVAAAPASAQTVTAPAWSANGHVYDTVRLGPHRLLVAGNFTRIGRPTGAVGLLSRTTARTSAFPVFDGGPVRAFADDGSGGWFVGGEFRTVGGLPREGLAHVLADGTVDPAFAPSILAHEGPRAYQGSVRALVVTSGRLVVGGVFDQIDGTTRTGLAAFELADGSLASWDPNPEGEGASVRALAADGSTVFVGGFFDGLAGAARHGIGAVDATTGVASPWDPDAQGVRTIAIDAGTVYLGGTFDAVASQPRQFLAAVDEISGEPTAWTPQPDSPVNALALDAATLYAGTDDGVVAFSRASGAGAWSRAGDETEALLADAGVLYVAGGFDKLAGNPRNGLGALDTATGAALPWNPDPAVFDMPELPSTAAYALASAPGGILAGGGFRSFRGVHRRGLAVVDPATGAVAPWNAWVNGPVWALTRSHGRTYALGSFTRIRGGARSGAAALDTRLHLLRWNPPKLNAGPADDVTVFDGKVVLTGFFNWVGRGRKHGSIAAFDPVRGRLLDWGPQRLLGTGMQIVGTRGHRIYAILDNDPFTVVLLDRRTGRIVKRHFIRHNADVYAAVLRGRTLYLGGAFSRVGGKPRKGLAAVDAVTGRVLGWRSDTDQTVFSLAVSDGTLFAGGQFTNLGGQARAGIAALDARTAAVKPWSPFAAGFTGHVLHTGAGLAFSGDLVALPGSYWPYFAFLD